MQMQMLVRGYLVFDITGSYAALGTLALAMSLPGLVLTMPGGVVADRFNKKRVVQLGQAASGLMTLGLAGLIWTGQLEYWHLVASAALQSGIMALIMPARQSWLPEIVGMGRLMNASALNMGSMSMASLIAPAGGAFLFAGVGAAWVFVLMTFFYFCTVTLLFRVPNRDISLTDAPGRSGVDRSAGGGSGGTGSFRDMWDGLIYLIKEPTLRMLLMATLMITLCSMPYQIMLPGFVKEVLGGDKEMLGILQSITAVGAGLGAMLVASSGSTGRGRILLAGAATSGLALILFSFSTIVWFSAITMVFIGLGQTFRMSLGQVLVQTYVKDEYRGRAMSVFMMQMNIVALGAFGVGLLAARIGPQAALGGLSAVLLVITALFYTFSPRLRALA